MFGIGWTEFMVIALVLLIFVGPKNLPPLFRKLGQLSAELKNASRELRNQLDQEVGQIETPKQILQEISADMLAAASAPYEEAAQADRELKQELASLKHDIQRDLSAASSMPPSSDDDTPPADKTKT